MKRKSVRKKTRGDRMVDRAVQLAVGDTDRRRARLTEGELVSSSEVGSADALLLEETGMLREEFYTRVTDKMQGLVDDMLEDLKERYKEIPPQNIAYSLGVLMKEVNNLNGRPQTLTSSINFGFGPKNRSREEVIALLSGEASKVSSEEADAGK